jgi:transposase
MNTAKVPQSRGRPRLRPERLAADMAYNARWIREWLKQHKIVDVIPRPENQQKPDQVFDKASYRCRNIIERLVGWLKECRAVFTRYDKLAVNYLAQVKVAIIQRYLRFVDSSDRA